MHAAERLITESDQPQPLPRAALIAALVPRVGFTSYPWLARALPPGASRFGGPADLPAGVAWPRAGVRPLLLLAQLNFADLPIEPHHPLVERLPKRGWLCLFTDVDADARGIANEHPGVVALQFDGDAANLLRHDPDPAPAAQVWTHCHAVSVCPADHHLCLPAPDAVDSPLPAGATEELRGAYESLRWEIDDLARTAHEVCLLGAPTLFNPDPRRSLPDPGEWMLLLQFDGRCRFLAGAAPPDRESLLSEPTFGSADFVQYFVRKSDYAAGRLDRGYLEYMLT